MQDVDGDGAAVEAEETGQGGLEGCVGGEDVEGGGRGRRGWLGEREVDVGVGQGADGVGDGFLFAFAGGACGFGHGG